MAAAKSKSPSASAVFGADGSLSLGAEVDGVFVPCITLPGFRVAQLVENAKGATHTSDSETSEGGSE